MQRYRAAKAAYAKSEAGKAANVRYLKSEKGKAKRKALNEARKKDPARLAYLAEYRKSTAYRSTRRKYEQSEKGRAAARRRAGRPEPTRPCPAACECCNVPAFVLDAPLVVDHDHETGKFRGWLCFNCNTSIGKLGDSVQGLLRAVAYLEKIE